MELPLDAGITAVFVANDRMALGVLRALTERGVRVPEDVSVAGIDDIPEAAYFGPPLTTVRVASLKAGRVAAASLIGHDRAPGGVPPGVPGRTSSIPRASTALAPREAT